MRIHQKFYEPTMQSWLHHFGSAPFPAVMKLISRCWRYLKGLRLMGFPRWWRQLFWGYKQQEQCRAEPNGSSSEHKSAKPKWEQLWLVNGEARPSGEARSFGFFNVSVRWGASWQQQRPAVLWTGAPTGRLREDSGLGGHLQASCALLGPCPLSLWDRGAKVLSGRVLLGGRRRRPAQRKVSAVELPPDVSGLTSTLTQLSFSWLGGESRDRSSAAGQDGRLC